MKVWVNISSDEIDISDSQMKKIKKLKKLIKEDGSDEMLFLLEKTLKGYEIKKCQCCGRVFLGGKRVNYCSRKFKNVSATCQEHGSRQEYIKRQKKNPICLVYVTCYNKLYSRFRKGNLDKDSPLWGELTALRDEYISKYELNPSEDVVNEFKKLCKEL